jgi:hypothetical protein
MASLLEELERFASSMAKKGPARRPPVVRLVLSSGDEIKLNGIVVSPLASVPGLFSVRPLTTDRPLILVRDDQVLVAELEPVEPPSAGFTPEP